MFNTIIISGRLTAIPEMKKTNSGKEVTSFSIANETGWGDNKKTNFLNVVAWEKTAKLICDYFRKGDMIGIEGQLEIRKYKDKNGNDRTIAEVVARGVQFMQGKGKTSDAETDIANSGSNARMEDEDDDLPF